MLKIHSVPETREKLLLEMIKKFTWECPCCSEHFESEEYESPIGFANRLISEEKIRYVTMDAMQGLFCSECYNDTEIQKSSL